MSNFNGKRISFNTLIKSNWILKIPMIQRDFAMGRKEQLPEAKNFIESLLRVMTKTCHDELDLNFIYGSTNETEEFTIIDGQQRLTVLFLLQWYLEALKNDFSEFRRHLLKNDQSSFLYETRASASEFSNALIVSATNINQLINNSPSGQNFKNEIANQHWFLKSWESDPTVMAMLSLLEVIHDISIEHQIEKKEINFDRINFQIFDIQAYDLTDELYIKMNARGKPLSDWQNFKAYLYEFINDDSNDERIQPHDWEEALDKRWLDFFWKHTENKERVEENLLAYFQNILVSDYIDRQKDYKHVNKDIFAELLNPIEGGIVNFCKRNNLLSTSYINRCFLGLDSLLSLDINLFNAKLKRNTPWHFTSLDFRRYLFPSKKGTVGFYDRSYFNAVLLGLRMMHNTSDSMQIDNMDRWLRVTRNLIFNQNIDNTLRLFNVLKALAIIEKSGEYIIDKFPLKNLRFAFTKIQIEDELSKRELIFNNKPYQEFIYKLEDHFYLYGQVNFIFLMSTNSDKSIDFKQAQIIGDKLCSAIDKYVEDKNFVFQRALLTKGFYFGQRSKNYTLCLWDHNTVRDRNENWRTVFNDEEKREYLKELLKDSNPYGEIIELSTVSDWRKRLLDQPRIFEYATEGLIRKVSYNNIRILKTTSIGGRQGELLSLWLYFKYFENANISKYYPFTNIGYFTAIGQNEIPCAYIDKWSFDEDSNYSIDIFFHSHSNIFCLRFFNRNSRSIHKSICDVLVDYGFVKGTDDEFPGYYYMIQEEDVIKKTIDLLNNFKGLIKIKP